MTGGGPASSCARAASGVSSSKPRTIVVEHSASAARGSRLLCMRSPEGGVVFIRSEHELDSALEEVCRAARAEPVEHAIAVSERESELVGGVPGERRRHPPELAALDGAIIGVRVGGVDGALEGPRPAIEQRVFGIDEVEQ